MNSFIKKNLFLVGVLLLTAVAGVILLTLSVMQHIEMRKHIDNTEGMRNTNKTLMKQNPPAVVENLKLLNDDIAGYSKVFNNFSRYFGHPLQPALKVFAEKIKVDEEKLRKLFAEFWETEKESESPREVTYRRFRATLGKIGENTQALWTLTDWDAALAAFVEKAQPTTLEPIDEHNRESIFLSSLGLLRNLGNNDQRLEIYGRAMHGKINDLFSEKNVSALGVSFFGNGIDALATDLDFQDQGRRGITDGGAAGMAGGFNPMDLMNDPMMTGGGSMGGQPGGQRERRKANSAGSMGMGVGAAGLDPMALMTGAEMVTRQPQTMEKTEEEKKKAPNMIRSWEIMSDLARRMADSKIDILEDMTYGDINGREVGKCTFYTYEFTIQGTQKSLRDFVNNLNGAYRDNRVYVIRNFSLHKVEDQAQDLIDVAQGILSDKEEENQSKNAAANGMMDPMGIMMDPMMMMNGPDGMGGMQGNNPNMEPDFFKEKGDYGELVVGRSTQCTLTLVVDYVVYSANILK